MKIELDSETNTLTVDGCKMALELLAALANPDPSATYRMVRRGDTTHVTVRRTPLQN